MPKRKYYFKQTQNNSKAQSKFIKFCMPKQLDFFKSKILDHLIIF